MWRVRLRCTLCPIRHRQRPCRHIDYTSDGRLPGFGSLRVGVMQLFQLDTVSLRNFLPRVAFGSLMRPNKPKIRGHRLILRMRGFFRLILRRLPKFRNNNRRTDHQLVWILYLRVCGQQQRYAHTSPSANLIERISRLNDILFQAKYLLDETSNPVRCDSICKRLCCGTIFIEKRPTLLTYRLRQQGRQIIYRIKFVRLLSVKSETARRHFAGIAQFQPTRERTLQSLRPWPTSLHCWPRCFAIRPPPVPSTHSTSGCAFDPHR